MSYIVLWKNNGRIGSVKATEHNRQLVLRLFAAHLIQRDLSGLAEHYECCRAPSDKEIKGLEFET